MFKIITSAALIALAVASSPAAADTITTTCGVLRVGHTFERSCSTTIEHDAPAAQVESGPLRGSGSTEQVRFDPADEARKLAIPKHDPASINLCPSPWHMSALNGCRQ